MQTSDGTVGNVSLIGGKLGSSLERKRSVQSPVFICLGSLSILTGCFKTKKINGVEKFSSRLVIIKGDCGLMSSKEAYCLRGCKERVFTMKKKKNREAR